MNKALDVIADTGIKGNVMRSPDRGVLVVKGDVLNFSSKSLTLSIPAKDIDTAYVGRRTGDSRWNWVIVKYRSQRGAFAIVCFKKHALLYNPLGTEGEIYSALSQIIPSIPRSGTTEEEFYSTPNQVQCPKCKNYRTYPYSVDPSSDNNSFPNFATSFGSYLRGMVGADDYDPISFDNHWGVQKFLDGEVRARCDFCGFIFDANTTWNSETHNSAKPNIKTSEERLTELTDLQSKGLITSEEYDRKREEILRSL